MLQQHKKRALQNTSRRWQRFYADVFQSDPRGLALETGWSLQNLETEVVHFERWVSLLL
jgi:hypothetical protein